MNNNRSILIVISVILLGIFAVVLVEANKKTPAEKIGDSISNAVDDAGSNLRGMRDDVEDEIDKK